MVDQPDACLMPVPFVLPKGGSTLIFSYKRRLLPFLGFKIFSFNNFGSFQRTEYFGGYE